MRVVLASGLGEGRKHDRRQVTSVTSLPATVTARRAAEAP